MQAPVLYLCWMKKFCHVPGSHSKLCYSACLISEYYCTTLSIIIRHRLHVCGHVWGSVANIALHCQIRYPLRSSPFFLPLSSTDFMTCFMILCYVSCSSDSTVLATQHSSKQTFKMPLYWYC